MMINIPYSFEDELEKVQSETIKKTIFQQETNQKLIQALTARDLPLTPELQQLAIQQSQFEQMMQGGGPPGGGEGGPGQSDSEQGSPGQGPGGQGGGPGEQGGESQGGPDQGQGESPQGGPSSGPPQDRGRRSFQPRNQLRQRPEVSDNQRSRAPRAVAMYVEGPTPGERIKKISEEKVTELVEKRPWAKALDPDRV
jgi:hypothetical protein